MDKIQLSHLYGRDDVINDVVSTIRSEAKVNLFISGDPGIGKTTSVSYAVNTVLEKEKLLVDKWDNISIGSAHIIRDLDDD